MVQSRGPLWETVVDRSPRTLALCTTGLGFAGMAFDWRGGSGAALVCYLACLALAAMVVRNLTNVSFRPSWTVVYHSDDEGLLVAPRKGPALRLPWGTIVEMREGPLGALHLVSRDAQVRLPRRVAQREAFGMAAFERVVPRLASDLWEGIMNGRVVAVAPARPTTVVALVLGLAVGAAIMMPSWLAWGLGLVALGMVLFVATQPRRKGVFLSARGVGDRDQFIAWEGAELSEGRWTLVVRDPDTGWVARVPRTAVNYHAVAVVARTAQALSGCGVESVAFRSAHDSGGVRIVVEGTRQTGSQYH